MDKELQELVDNYQPNEQVLKAMANIRVLATAGPSASGKTTVMKKLVELSGEVGFVLDETSREPRHNETDGVDFLFRTKRAIMNDLEQGLLVQVAVGPNGDLYCTRLESYPEGIGLLPLVPAAVKLFRKLPIKEFKAAFIVPSSFEKWQYWLSIQAQSSDWDEAKKLQRLEEAKKSYEFALDDGQIYFVLNDDPDRATQRLMQIIRGSAPEAETQAKEAALTNYRELSQLLGK